jgi:hypothetical protein
MNKLVYYIGQFLFVMIFQIFILNDMNINSSISILGIPSFIPMLFPVLILLLPIRSNYYVMMAYAVVIGFALDLFSNTPGLHAASLVLLAFLRPRLLRLFFQQDEKKLGWARPTVYRLGFMPFLFYICFSIGIHHLFFFLLQEWSLMNILIILYKTIISGVLSVLLILIGQFIFYSKPKFVS